jgi:hypothetical protein
MTDERPRPQYGEYATPEQQARALGLSPADTKAAIQAAAAAHAAAATRAANLATPPPNEANRVAAPAPTGSPSSSAKPSGSESAARAPSGLYSGVRHPIDRFFTVFLLGLGAFFLATSIPSYLNFAAALAAGYKQFGGGAFPQQALADQVGVWMLVAHMVVFFAAALWAVRRLAHGRVASFVPVVGFVVFVLVFFIAFTVLYNAEPAYFQQLDIFGS